MDEKIASLHFNENVCISTVLDFDQAHLVVVVNLNLASSIVLFARNIEKLTFLCHSNLSFQEVKKMGVFTESEVNLLAESWVLIEPDKEKHGIEFFIRFAIKDLDFDPECKQTLFRLFSENPEVQQKHFPQMDVNEIQTLKKHGLGVMNDIEMMINLAKDGKDDLLVKKIHSVSDLGKAVVTGLESDSYAQCNAIIFGLPYKITMWHN